MSHTSVIASTASILGAKVVLRETIRAGATTYKVCYVAENMDVRLFQGVSRNSATMWFQKVTDKVMNGWVPE